MKRILVLFIVVLLAKYAVPDTAMWCDKPSQATCENIKACYDACDDLTYDREAEACRDRIRPYLWKCFMEEKPNLRGY